MGSQLRVRRLLLLFSAKLQFGMGWCLSFGFAGEGWLGGAAVGVAEWAGGNQKPGFVTDFQPMP